MYELVKIHERVIKWYFEESNEMIGKEVSCIQHNREMKFAIR